MNIFAYIWNGIWTGVGVELSVFALWVIWRFLHSKIAHRIGVDHWFHTIAEYFE